jgi:hypothetical protein
MFETLLKFFQGLVDWGQKAITSQVRINSMRLISAKQADDFADVSGGR